MKNFEINNTPLSYPIIFKPTPFTINLYFFFNILIPVIILSKLPSTWPIILLALGIFLIPFPKNIYRSCSPAIIISEDGISYFKLFAKNQQKFIPWKNITVIRDSLPIDGAAFTFVSTIQVYQKQKDFKLFNKAFRRMDKCNILTIQNKMLKNGVKVSHHKVIAIIKQSFEEKLPERYEQELQRQREINNRSSWWLLFDTLLAFFIIITLTAIGTVLAVSFIVLVVGIIYFLYTYF